MRRLHESEETSFYHIRAACSALHSGQRRGLGHDGVSAPEALTRVRVDATLAGHDSDE